VAIALGIWYSPRRNGGGALTNATSSRPARASEDAILSLAQAAAQSASLASLTVDYPLDGAIFPPQFPPPTLLWHDSSPAANHWLVDVTSADGSRHVYAVTRGDTPSPPLHSPGEEIPEAARDYKPGDYQASARRWRPPPDLWEEVQRLASGGPATLSIVGFDRAWPKKPVSRATIAIATSPDPVGAPVFYRDVPLPFAHALKNLHLIRWRLGDVTSDRPPPILLKDMRICGNCHSFTPDGKTLAMDVDYGNDKGSYVIAPIQPQTILDKQRVITWSDYRRDDGQLTFGLLAQISPDGRYAISTVKDRSVFSPVPDLHYSQRFFPIKGILVLYDRQANRFFPLPGADDPRYVQTNPVWSPDGSTILFARAEAYELTNLKDRSAFVIAREEAREFFEGGKTFRYDIYRIPFNDGNGGQPAPLDGASANGRSNFFPRFSPDGRWIVFCQAGTFMLLRPDSLLYIMPAHGGRPRLMCCNLPGKMNSWHSFSPNGRWLVFASKANGPYTQLWLAHVDADGNDAPPVLLEWFTAPDRAANIPEFVNVSPGQFASIRQEFADYYTHFRIALNHERHMEFERAIDELRLALQEKPDYPDAVYLMGSCLARAGRESEALPFVRKIVELEPTRLEGRRLLGVLLGRRGQYKQAIEHLSAVIKARPEDNVAANNLAWLLATCPDPACRDGRQAVELAERTCKATQNSVPTMLDTLAAAYAEVGRYAAAVDAAQRALALLRRTPGTPTRELEQRLILYRSGKPYREPPTSP